MTSVQPNQLDPNMAPAPDGGPDLRWHSPKDGPFRLSGFCWLETEDRYRRLPVQPPWPLPEPVDRLADSTAGGQIRFRTDSATLAVRVELAGPPNMDHMPATGQCGFDAYVGEPGTERYWATARPRLGETHYEVMIGRADDRPEREITLNFPLYQGVVSVEIGLDPDATVAAPTPFGLDRVVIYGTSITQGGCASRPGMAYPAILGRRIPAEFVNLGFSGNGRGEPEVARTIAQIDEVSCFVLDYHANQGNPDLLRSTGAEFIEILRERHPNTPILFMSRPSMARELVNNANRLRRITGRDTIAEVVAEARAAGDEQVHFLDVSDLDITEGTVDGVHPTDLGFLQLADLVEPTLRTILGLAP